MDLLIEELSPSFLRTVELAAVAAARTRGRGDKDASDRAATPAMREHLNKIRMRGVVRVGEGELDGCDAGSMLTRGEKLGLGWLPEHAERTFPEIDIAVDPLEGTALCADGYDNAIATAAFGERGGIIDAPDIYADKLVVGPSCRGKIDINAPIEDNINAISAALNRDVDELTFMVLNRPRHYKLIERIRNHGASVSFIDHGDLTAAILSGLSGTGIHGAIGIGGSPEGFLAAAAIGILGGEIQMRFLTKEMLQNADDRAIIPDDVAERLRNFGLVDPTGVLRTGDLVPSRKIVFAFCAVTDSRMRNGVRLWGKGKSQGYSLQSMMMMEYDGVRVLRKSEVTEVTNMPDFVFKL